MVSPTTGVLIRANSLENITPESAKAEMHACAERIEKSVCAANQQQEQQEALDRAARLIIAAKKSGICSTEGANMYMASIKECAEKLNVRPPLETKIKRFPDCTFL